MKRIYLIFLVLLIGLQCTTHRLSIAELEQSNAKDKSSSRFYRNYFLNKYYLPEFTVELKKLPDNQNSSYNIVLYNDRIVSKAYHVVVERKHNDFRLKSFFKFSAKGLKKSEEIGESFDPGDCEGKADTPEEAIIYFGIVTVSILSFQIGGLAIDIVRSPYVAYRGISNVVRPPYEVVVGFTIYGYDTDKRLKQLNFFASSDPPELIHRMEYLYSGNSRLPSSVIINNSIENRKKTIVFDN